MRILWPSGILQAETDAGPAPPAGTRAALAVTELDRKPSSCPFLFAWNGERFEFVTDFLGGGEMGYWRGARRVQRPRSRSSTSAFAPAISSCRGTARYELRVTNELEEALYLDRLQLLAVDHPDGRRGLPERRA